MATSDRNYQLQGSYTRYYDGLHAGYDSIYGPNKRRNFATMKSAMRAAKKELRENELPKAVRCEEERYGSGEYQRRLHFYAEDGHKFDILEEDFAVWHVDGLRIVDRETQKVLWEA